MTQFLNPNDDRISDKTYKIKKLIAEGGFSFVYHALPSNPKKSKHPEFAVKKMIIQTKEQRRAAQWEIEVLKQLQSQHQRFLRNEEDGMVPEEEEKNALIMNDMKRIDEKYKGRNNFIVELIDSTMERHKKIPEFQIAYMV